MRILHFVPVYKPAWRYGGPVRSVSQLCEELAANEVDVSVLTTNANGKSALDVMTNQPIDVDGVQVCYCEYNQMPWGIDSMILRREIERLLEGFDLVHMSAMWQPLGIVVARAAKKEGIPYIYSLRGGVNAWAWGNRRLKHRIYWTLFEKKTIADASALHVTCELENEEALTHGIGTNQHFITIPNGIKFRDYARQRDAAAFFREAMGLDPEKRIILSFGRIHPKKGIDIFLRSAADLLREAEDWIYLIVGPDDHGHREILSRLVDDLGVSARVRFQDTLHGKMRLGAYSAAEIFVLTSHTENFGMSVVEAMAASVPVLISDQVGISRDIKADAAGEVVSLTPSAIHQSLSRLMDSAELRLRYRMYGLQSVQKRYDIHVVAKMMASVYADILGQIGIKGA